MSCRNSVHSRVEPVPLSYTGRPGGKPYATMHHARQNIEARRYIQTRDFPSVRCFKKNFRTTACLPYGSARSTAIAHCLEQTINDFGLRAKIFMAVNVMQALLCRPYHTFRSWQSSRLSHRYIFFRVKSSYDRWQQPIMLLEDRPQHQVLVVHVSVFLSKWAHRL